MNSTAERRGALGTPPPEGAVFVDLARRIETGDPGAEAELVETLGRGVSYLLRRLTGDRELSEDLYQETFRIVLSSLRRGGVEEPSRLAGFVRGTARNLVRSEWRKQSRRGPHDDIADMTLVDPSPGQWDHATLVEDRLRVRRVLGQMASERDRQILYRHYLAEESKDEICDQLSIGESQFNLVLFRARRRFRQLLERDEKKSGLRLMRGGGDPRGESI